MCKQENSTQEYKCIRTVGEYINAIQEIIEQERKKNSYFDNDFDKEYEVYFRGHIDKDFFLIPSLLRNKPGNKDLVGQACKEIVDNEHIAFRSLVAKHPSEFAECKSAIEHLVKMQHYGLKTRLLDITSNALVALYFACKSSKDRNNKTGSVIVFKLPKTIIKHYDSDTISAIANIAKCKTSDLQFPLCGYEETPYEFTEGIRAPSIEPKELRYKYVALFFLSKLREAISGNSPSKTILETKKKLDDYFLHYAQSKSLKQLSFDLNKDIHKLNTYKKKSKNKYDKFLDRIEEKISIIHEKINESPNYTAEYRKRIRYRGSPISHGYREWFNKKLGYLHHQIKAEKPYYNPGIEPFDLGKIWAVKTKLDNNRIINQKGAFLLFGLGVGEIKENNIKQLAYTKEFYPEIPEDWIAGRIDIGNQYKEQIIDQLRIFGIHNSFIFPELETVAEEINQQLLSSTKESFKSPEDTQQKDSLE